MVWSRVLPLMPVAPGPIDDPLLRPDAVLPHRSLPGASVDVVTTGPVGLRVPLLCGFGRSSIRARRSVVDPRGCLFFTGSDPGGPVLLRSHPAGRQRVKDGV